MDLALFQLAFDDTMRSVLSGRQETAYSLEIDANRMSSINRLVYNGFVDLHYTADAQEHLEMKLGDYFSDQLKPYHGALVTVLYATKQYPQDAFLAQQYQKTCQNLEQLYRELGTTPEQALINTQITCDTLAATFEQITLNPNLEEKHINTRANKTWVEYLAKKAGVSWLVGRHAG